MVGVNLFNQTNQSTQQQPSFSSPGLNTSATFGSASTSNLSFDSNITAGTSFFGSPNATVSQANSSFASSTMGTPTSNANKPAFGFGLAGSTVPASTAGGMTSFGAVTPTKPSFNASSASRPIFGASQPTFNTASSSQPAFGEIVSGQSTFGSTTTGQSTFGGTATASLTVGGVAAAQATSSGAAVAQPIFGGAVIKQPTFGGTAAAQLSFGGTPAQPALSADAAAQPVLSATAAAQPSFGTTATAQPTFGGSSAGQLIFGGTAASAQPIFDGIAVTAQPTAGGVVSAQSTFGASTTTQQPTFSAVTSQPLSFAAPSIQQSSLSTAPAQPLSFGSSTMAPTSSFAASTTSAVPLFGPTSSAQTPLFGAISASTISAPSSTLNARDVTSSAPTVSFSTPSITSLPFGTVTTTAAQTSSFDTNNSQPISFAAPATALSTSTTTSTLSFDATSIAQATPKLATLITTTSQPVSITASSAFPGLNASAATSIRVTTSTPGLFGLSSVSGTNSSTTSTPYPWSKLSTASSTSQTSTSAGLGGIDHSAVTATKSSVKTITSVKEQPLPNEIQQTVIAFKEYVKTQKNLSSEIARTSAEPLNKLTHQIASLNNLILTLRSVLLQQKFTTERIKAETIKSLNDYELAQKMKDSPVASEERLWSVRKYFAEKISGFEENTKKLQERIEYVYQHVMTLPQENSLSVEALKLIVKKLHDSFMVIGSGAYKLHNDLQLLKVQYLTLRSCYIKDNSSISFSMNHELQLPYKNVGCTSARSSLEGPNPFSKSGSGSFNSLLLTAQNCNLAAGSSKEWGPVSANTTANPFSVGKFAANSLLDKKYTLTSPSTNQRFNSPKSPLGNKLAKRQLF